MLAIAKNFDTAKGINWNSDNGGSVFSSTYKTVQTNSEYSGSNFPVIVVSLANIKSVDEQIKTALSLLTNSRSVSLTGNGVQVTICNTYKYDKASTKFVKGEPSITFKNGRFTAPLRETPANKITGMPNLHLFRGITQSKQVQEIHTVYGCRLFLKRRLITHLLLI